MYLRSDSDFIDKDGYYHHSCGCKLIRVTPNTQLQNVVTFCKKCRMEVTIKNIINGRIAEQIPNKSIA